MRAAEEGVLERVEAPPFRRGRRAGAAVPVDDDGLGPPVEHGGGLAEGRVEAPEDRGRRREGPEVRGGLVIAERILELEAIPGARAA